MNAQELALNIAVNLGRLGRWALDGNKKRIDQFLIETEQYLLELEKADKTSRFEQTFLVFKKQFNNLKQENISKDWAEQMFTWANILTHRAKLT